MGDEHKSGNRSGDRGRMDEPGLSDEERTPTAKREPSAEARTLANLAVVLNALATHVGSVASRLDSTEGAERAGLLAGIAHQLGELGDSAHEARRLIAGPYGGLIP